jgi:FkbM family methyltransferase
MPSDPMIAQWRALAAAPSDRQAWIDIGRTLEKAGRRDEARAVLATVLERWPNDAEAWAVAASGGRREAVEAALARATTLAPRDASLWRRLGEAISSQQPERALQAFTAALARDAGDIAAQRGAGIALLRLGRTGEARQALEKALALRPEDPLTHRTLAWFHLDHGEAKAGWFHLACSRVPLVDEWQGGNLAGKTVTVIAEGTLDDALPLLGAIPLLAARGAKVTVSAPVAWVPLLAGLEGVAAIRPEKDGAGDCDAAVPLTRLPWRLGLSGGLPPGRISAKPADLPAPLGTRLKVGLLWASRQAEDDGALDFETLMPVTGMAGAAFYGLQTGARTADLRRVADPALITDLSPRLRSLADLAQAVAALDLVIAVEGPMAYLAQSLGKPVWLLRPHHGDRAPPQAEGLRLFRQPSAGDWRSPVAEIGAALASLVAERSPPATELGPMLVNSIFPDAAGNPRFRMTAPRSFLSDPGIRYLVARERAGTGYEYATRSFLDAQLLPGDLFIDIGAHWGIMSLQAATRWPGQVKVLAVEPSPHNLPHLKDWLASNKVEAETVWAFAADAPGRGRLAPQSTMGHSLIRAEDGAIPVVTIDGLLADRRSLRDAGRVVVKIDVEGNEPEVIEGMKELMAGGKVAAVIWERGREYDSPTGQKRLAALRARFAAWGYSAWRFESEDRGGPLVPFVEDGRLGNVFELRTDVAPMAVYGGDRPKPLPQPDDPALDAALRARNLFAQGLEAHKAGKAIEARDLYRQAAALDGTQSGPFNNLGAVFRNQGNRLAAAAAFRRALALAPGDLGVLSNCGNSLREVGAFGEAEAILRRALIQRPNDAGLIYNLGVVRKDTDRPEQAVLLFDRALLLSTEDPEYRWDRSLALLQAGDYRRGFEGYESRWGLKRAAKRKSSLPRWDGSPLEGRSLFLSDEQGFGDVLQWARFVAPLKKRGAGRIVMECQPELMRLMSLLAEVDEVAPRAKTVPDCDLTLPLLSLPHLFGTTLETLPAKVPYLRAPETHYRLADDGRLKLGLVWAGKPTPRDRSIGLEKLLPLLGDPRIAAYSLQIGPRAADLGKLGADLLITDLAPKLADFAETAAILQQLDLLITIDSAVAHLAGALGVKTFLLLRKVSDWRWFDDRTESPWYPSMTLFRQKTLDVWDDAVDGVRSSLIDYFRHNSKKSQKEFNR